MNYNEFKEKVINEFLDYLPESFGDCRLEVMRVNKVNIALDGLVICKEDNADFSVAPTIYIDYLYYDYKRKGDFDKVMKNAVNELENAICYKPKIDKDIFENFRDKVVFEVVNYDMNRELLKTSPYRRFLDLAIIYRLVVNMEEDYVQTAIINNEMLKMLNTSEEELYGLAMKNTKELFGVSIKPIEEVIFGDMVEDSPMLIVTNERGVKGAGVIVYEEILKKIGERLGERFCILPSSVHEVIAVKYGENVEELKEMVRVVNREQVEVQERLSDGVYLWNGKLQCLE